MKKKEKPPYHHSDKLLNWFDNPALYLLVLTVLILLAVLAIFFINLFYVDP